MSKDLDLTYFLKPLDYNVDSHFQTLVQVKIKNFHDLINKTLDEYFQRTDDEGY